MENNNECEKNLIREFKKVQILFEKNLNKILEKYDLTSSQASIISYLFEAEKQNKEVQQKDLEEFFYLKNPTVTGILDRLEIKKYIVRKISKLDKRKRLIYLTPKARKIHEEANECVMSFRDKTVKGITKEEFAAVISIVNKMSSNLDNIDKI